MCMSFRESEREIINYYEEGTCTMMTHGYYTRNGFFNIRLNIILPRKDMFQNSFILTI